MSSKPCDLPGTHPHHFVELRARWLKARALVLISLCLLPFVLVRPAAYAADRASPTTHERMFERTFTSTKRYADPFNDVEVDVIFSRQGQSWRVPAFWQGEQAWTVRFAPPTPGEYTYRLESTDRRNPDLNGRAGKIHITAYSGNSPVLKHGMLKVSDNKHHFTFADGTPFYWLGDTWWTGLSSRLSWEDFQVITADRKQKGFTVVQIVAGLIPLEEVAPSDPGFANEGGAVWDAGFHRINPKYFDYADRRLLHLMDQGMVPAIVGAWTHLLKQAGPKKIKQHWRYLIARYGAYPVFWIAGGEVFDPPAEIAKTLTAAEAHRIAPWSDVVRYIRATDPYHHPISVHDIVRLPSLQEPGLSDFHFFQCGHSEWSTIPRELERLHQHYAQAQNVKPIVIAEIGYEKLGGANTEDFQRVAFWLAMLNGAAGFTYGANGLYEAYSSDKPLHRMRWGFYTWQEGLQFPGAYQIGIGAKLLQRQPWWQLAPQPQWVTPRGDWFGETKAAPQPAAAAAAAPAPPAPPGDPTQAGLPKLGDSVIKKGNFFLPYAAGIPGKLRLIYMPYLNFMYGFVPAPTVLGLEPNVAYRAHLWDPVHGIQLDLGRIQRPAPGKTLYQASDATPEEAYTVHLRSAGDNALRTISNIHETDVVASIEVKGAGETGLVVRFIDAQNYLSALYSPQERAIYLMERRDGVDGPKFAWTPTGALGERIRLSTEVRGYMGVVSISDGQSTITSPIVDVFKPGFFAPRSGQPRAGAIGFWASRDAVVTNFEARKTGRVPPDADLKTALYDAEGGYRGELRGEGIDIYNSGVTLPGWDDFAKDKHILLDAYRPERLPFGQDWLLVLEAIESWETEPPLSR